MKPNKLKILTLIVIVAAACDVAVRAQRYDDASPLPVEKINQNATQISGYVTGVQFSPSGNLMILQTDAGFYLVPTEKLDQLEESFKESRFPYLEGWAKNFLPSEKVVFSTRRGLYAVDAQKSGTQTIFQMSAADEERGIYSHDGEMIVASENLIISGDGDYDMGSEKGNILRFDVSRQRVTRGARINGFKNGQLSPSRRYVSYEHGGETSFTADIYDIRRDVNSSIPRRFNFKLHFPKYKEVLVTTLSWIEADKLVVTVDQNQFEEFETKNFDEVKDTPAWLVLLDVAAGKVVWKRQIKDELPPSFLEQLGPAKASFASVSGRYEISLADGQLTKLPEIEGTLFVVSPDKKRMAYLNGSQIFVSAASGAEKKSVFDFPESWDEGMGVRSMHWSPDGKRLLVFDETRLLIIRL